MLLFHSRQGNHTNVWTYSKGANNNSTGVPFTDSGWVDRVSLGFPPQITVQPASQVVAQGSNPTLSATATGTPPFGFQWFWNGTPVSGGVSSNLALNNVQPTSGGAYVVVVSNNFGSCDEQRLPF